MNTKHKLFTLCPEQSLGMIREVWTGRLYTGLMTLWLCCATKVIGSTALMLLCPLAARAVQLHQAWRLLPLEVNIQRHDSGHPYDRDV